MQSKSRVSVRAAARQIREDSLRKNSLEMPDNKLSGQGCPCPGKFIFADFGRTKPFRAQSESRVSVRAAARQIREDSLRKNSLEMPDRGILSIRRGGVPSPSAENLSLQISGGQSRFERKVKVAFRCGLPHGKFVKIACVKIHLKCPTGGFYQSVGAGFHPRPRKIYLCRCREDQAVFLAK